MFKKIFGTVVILLLVVLIVINGIRQYQKSATSDQATELYDLNGDHVQGAALMAPNQLGIEVGEVAPDFELETLSGETIRLSELRGKKVILNFWGTWCPPCREEMPEMQRFYEDNNQEVEIVAINLTSTETSEDDVHRFIEKFQYTYPVLLDRDKAVSEAYVAIVVPTTYIIGTDGVIQQPRKMGPMTYEFMEDVINAMN